MCIKLKLQKCFMSLRVFSYKFESWFSHWLRTFVGGLLRYLLEPVRWHSVHTTNKFHKTNWKTVTKYSLQLCAWVSINFWYSRWNEEKTELNYLKKCLFLSLLMGSNDKYSCWPSIVLRVTSFWNDRQPNRLRHFFMVQINKTFHTPFLSYKLTLAERIHLSSFLPFF